MPTMDENHKLEVTAEQIKNYANRKLQYAYHAKSASHDKTTCMKNLEQNLRDAEAILERCIDGWVEKDSILYYIIVDYFKTKKERINEIP